MTCLCSYTPTPPTAGFTTLFRFTTKFELFLNAMGILGAIVAGAAQYVLTPRRRRHYESHTFLTDL